ncbi:MAG TPA: YeeE/YedE thiosulfate transporter family protein [Spirochaetota bacterium]|nr:YeeE/YedE thiosulfate transporter family protein [Spirochaetota bacterium]
MAPYDSIALFGKFAGYMVYLAIGIGFGLALEMSGFGDSRILSAQFYFRKMTVLKVMFTAIIVAMLLIFLFSAFGWLNFDNIWVNTTFIWPQIVGGLILGIGFIVGGFCPGTSIVAASTFKIDGIFFVLGVLFGVFILGETLSITTLEMFYNAGDYGRLTLYSLLGVEAGVVVVLVILMALMMFYGAGLSEKYFGEKIPWKNISLNPVKHVNPVFAGVLVLLSLIILIKGEPSLDARWKMLPEAEQQKLTARDVYIHPAELLEVMNNFQFKARILDLRSESDFNIFHILSAENIQAADVNSQGMIESLKKEKPNAAIVLVSNGEKISTEAYRFLRVNGVQNLYILEGGMNNWITVFGADKSIAVKKDPAASGSEDSSYIFNRAYGSELKLANPVSDHGTVPENIRYTKKVKIQAKAAKSGGCG